VRAGFLQFRPARLDAAANLAFVARALRGAGPGLVVLPELALSGYLFPSREALARCAEEVPGPSTERLAAICRAEGLHLVCGIAERRGADIFNSAVALGPGGPLAVYRKSHLFADEKELFSPGDTGFAAVDVEGARVGILICFDWIFPEAARTLALGGAQVIAHCANLVLPWAQAASVTRCIENRVFWVLANRTGEEEEGGRRCRFTGMSRVVGPAGELLAESGEETPCLATAEIDPGAALDKRVTPANHLFDDRRTDLYRL